MAGTCLSHPCNKDTLPMSALTLALLLSLAAGLSMAAGALIGVKQHIARGWLEQEVRHTVIAFGGGALLAAVALVLVPEGAQQIGRAHV